jgi:WD40 repeat protein
MFVTGGANGTVKLWDLAARKAVGTLMARSEVTSVAISPDARLVISVGKAGEAVAWIPEKGVHGLFNDRNDLQATSVAHNGDVVTLGCLDGSTRIYGLDNGKQEALRIIDLSSGGNYLVVTPDGLFDGTLGARVRRQFGKTTTSTRLQPVPIRLFRLREVST